MNQDITATTVRLIGVDGSQLGIFPLAEALQQAKSQDYDLAEIAPQAQPPVVKIIDWGKFQYEQTKQLQKSRKRQRQVEVKQVRLGLKIDRHDLEVKLNRARKFLGLGNKVKISLLFRGREITHPDLGRNLLARVSQELAEAGIQEQPAQMAGREMSMIIGPKKNAKNEEP